MEISIIVCTCNRAKRLPALFDNLARLKIQPGMTWELLVVDNASRDETPQIIEREITRDRLPVVYLKEPKPGKSRALNLALKNARGDLLVFTDDDVLPTPGWLNAYHEASRAYPAVSGFGGRVLPLWERGIIPDWLCTEGEYALPDGVINRRDFGEIKKLLPNKLVPGGLNAALQRSAAEQMGSFREDIGPGTLFPYAEDTEYFRRLYDLGGRYMYVPNALLYHKNPTNRMTKSYILKWTFHCARSEVQIHDYSKVRGFLGVPKYLLRQAVERVFLLIVSTDKSKRFFILRSFTKCIGELIGHIQKNLCTDDS